MGLSNKFKFDKVNKEIEHISNTDSYINFFNTEESSNNIQDIIAVVGDNGNGKTTFLKLIADLVRNDGYSFLGNFIIIISENIKSFKVYTDIEDLSIPKNDDRNNLIYESLVYDYDNSISSIADDLHLIYYSNALDNSATIYDVNEHEKVFDISTTHLIKNDELDNEGNDSFINYIQAEYVRQIEFVTSYQNSEKHLKFDIPKEIHVKTTGIDKKMSELINFVEPKEYYKDSSNISEDEYHYRDNFADILGSIQSKFNKSISNHIMDSLSYIKEKLVYLHLVISLDNHISNLDISRLDDSDLIKIENFRAQLDQNDIINSCIEYGEESGLLLDELRTRAILNDIEKKYKFLSPLDLNYPNDTIIYDIDKLMSKLKKNRKLYKKIIESKKTETEYIKSQVFEFFNLVCLEGINHDMMEIFWPLSTGQYNLLSLYSRLHEVSNSMSENHKFSENNILLLLDEGENSFHPRWQQQYVKSIIELVDDLFDNVNVQIILTTHSPILLSDIPGENVIYLNKYNKETENLKTFGSNIYNLYRQGFFLNGSNFGILGDFATDKLRNIGEILSKWEKEIDYIENLIINESFKEDEKNKKFNSIREKATSELEYCKKTIDIIGEKFIRDMLLEQYNDISKKLSINKDIINNIDDIKYQFNKLSIKDQNEFIRYIIEKRKK